MCALALHVFSTSQLNNTQKFLCHLYIGRKFFRIFPMFMHVGCLDLDG